MYRPYLQAVEKYFKKLLPILVPLQVNLAFLRHSTGNYFIFWCVNECCLNPRMYKVGGGGVDATPPENFLRFCFRDFLCTSLHLSSCSFFFKTPFLKINRKMHEILKEKWGVVLVKRVILNSFFFALRLCPWAWNSYNAILSHILHVQLLKTVNFNFVKENQR